MNEGETTMEEKDEKATEVHVGTMVDLPIEETGEEAAARIKAEQEKEKAERDADFAALNATVDAINVDIDKRNKMLRERIQLRHEYSKIVLEFELDRTQVRFELAKQMNDRATTFDLELHDLEGSIMRQVEEYEKQRKAYEDKWERLPAWLGTWLGFALGGGLLWTALTKKKR